MKHTILVLFFILALSANDGVHTFAKNDTCKVCHPLIYKEFSDSQHFSSTIYKDPIHNAVWQEHPQNTLENRYECGKCHTPVADDLDKMIAKGSSAMPNSENDTHNEAISCAYCHRIQAIKPGVKSNTNILSKEERLFFGARKDHVNSPFHGIDTSNNKNMQSGNICAGCHSHKQNQHGLNICSTNVSNEMNKANCVTCHMPKVSGTVSTVRKTPMHTYHGFPGTHNDNEMLADFISLQANKSLKGFSITIQNNASHAMLLHPLRVAKLKLSRISKEGISTPLNEETFVRVIGKDKQPAMPWIANTTLIDTMLKAGESRTFEYSVKLNKNEEIEAVLGYFLVNPKAIKSLGLDPENKVTKFIILKKERFRF